MKRKIRLFLAVVLMLVCALPISAAAANETSGSTDITLPVPFPTPTPTPTPDAGSGGGGGSRSSDSDSDTGSDGADETPTYSYIVNIPVSFAITSRASNFSISATKMDIPEGKEVVVRVDREKTFEPDGNFYLFLDGDKSSEHFVMCYIDRMRTEADGSVYSNSVMGSDTAIASFAPAGFQPHDWNSTRISPLLHNELAEGTYSGTVYYTIRME